MKKKQNSFSPNYAIPPGETLRETLNALGMTQAELGRRTGQSQKDVRDFIRGKALISVEMAHKLVEVLEVPTSFWVNLEKNYRKNLPLLRGGKNDH